jgi:hypothetical protein
MKLASLLSVVLLLGFCATVAVSMPGGQPDEKVWSGYPFFGTSIIPEQEPNNTCPGQAMACGDRISPASYNPSSDDDWYQFNVNVAGTLLTIGTTAIGGGGSPDLDTYLELYDVCGGTRLAYDDDGGPGTYSLISNFSAPHAGLYYVKTYTYGHYSTGPYELFVQCVEPQPPPPNDQCSGALPIERCTAGGLQGDSFLATNNYDPSIPGPSCTGYSASGKDVTYVMNLNQGDIVHLDYVLPADASFYIVTDCANVSGTCLIGADDTVTGEHEIIDWTAPYAGTFYVILDSWTSGYGGPWAMMYDITCPMPAHVCCLGHACYLIQESECAQMGGAWHPEWDSCNPNPCDIYTPADESSWGQIKNAYR